MIETTARSLPDDALLARVRRGDPHAFAALHDRYRPQLVRHAERVLGGRRSLAEDVVQESLWRAHRALVAGGDREIALQAWLHRIVHNRAVDELRRREVLSLEDRLDRCGASDDLQSLAERREGFGEVLADVIALPERQREALVGHVFAGENHAELAGRMGMTVGASKSLLNRARTSLARAHEARLAA